MTDFTQSSTSAASYKAEQIDRLPVGRDIRGAVLLAPGTTSNGPDGNVTFSGAASYEGLFLLNGVVLNETLRNQERLLFIEDAIEETKTSTAAISAEYGRFSGGVANIITKSGGNTFSGSFRVTFDNDKWRALTPVRGESWRRPASRRGGSHLRGHSRWSDPQGQALVLRRRPPGGQQDRADLGLTPTSSTTTASTTSATRAS